MFKSAIDNVWYTLKAMAGITVRAYGDKEDTSYFEYEALYIPPDTDSGLSALLGETTKETVRVIIKGNYQPEWGARYVRLSTDGYSRLYSVTRWTMMCEGYAMVELVEVVGGIAV